jgi:predicted ArsR family transcriptional regulator
MTHRRFIPPARPQLERSLFDSTSREAGHVAARFAGQRYRSILEYLCNRPGCIFEIAAALGCFDHQISGRFGELVKAGYIERSNQRRIKPATGCQAEEYRLTLLGAGYIKSLQGDN